MDFILLILAILPTVVLGTYIYKNDKIEKEPVSLLIKLLAFGVLATFLTIILTIVLGAIIPFFNGTGEGLDFLSLAIYVFFGIALIEEISKWIFTYVAAWNEPAFNHVYDAIVYSAFVSLGFATIENILYVLGNETFGDAISTAFIRMIFSVPGHAFFGVMMGYYLGLAKLTSINKVEDKSKKYLFLSVLIPATCHFLFDYLLMLNFDYSMLLFLAFAIFLFCFAMSKVKRMSKIPTLLFPNENNLGGIYNAFGNNANMNVPPRYCSQCGNVLNGPICSNCGKKNY